MNTAKQSRHAGLTLIEVMVVVLLIAVAVLGAMGFRLYCVTDAKKADVQVNAARIASMILENWKANGGLSGYDPVSALGMFTSQFEITSGASSGQYIVRDKANSSSASTGIFYFVVLSYTSATTTSPAVLNAAISWNQNYGQTGTSAHTISTTTFAD